MSEDLDFRNVNTAPMSDDAPEGVLGLKDGELVVLRDLVGPAQEAARIATEIADGLMNDLSATAETLETSAPASAYYERETQTMYFQIPRGRQGIPGETGERGPQGAQGVQGAAGQDGAQGPQGATGPQGVAGPQGATGASGAAGAKGDKGDKGDLGNTGATGPQGPQGLRGLKGDAGSSFTVNATGSLAERSAHDAQPAGYSYLDSDAGNLYIREGASGWSPAIPFGKGEQGETGPQGDQGPLGPQGPAGSQGLRGETGATGAQGPQGVAGAKGDKGDVGNTGPQGPVGATGARGPQGVAGAAGDTGPAGATGAKGDKGDVGNPGATGPAGARGEKGDDGLYANTAAQANTFPYWGNDLSVLKQGLSTQGRSLMNQDAVSVSGDTITTNPDARITGGAVQSSPSDIATPAKLARVDGVLAASRAFFGTYHGSTGEKNIDTLVAGECGLFSDANPGTFPPDMASSFVWIETRSIYIGTNDAQLAFSYAGGASTVAPRMWQRLRNTAGDWTPWVRFWSSDDFDVQTSPTDGSADALLKLGAFGLGANAISAANFDTISRSGFYFNPLASAVGAPTTSNYYLLQHISASSSYAIQIAKLHTGNSTLFIRTRSASAWTEWQKIFTDLDQKTDAVWKAATSTDPGIPTPKQLGLAVAQLNLKRYIVVSDYVGSTDTTNIMPALRALFDGTNKGPDSRETVFDASALGGGRRYWAGSTRSGRLILPKYGRVIFEPGVYLDLSEWAATGTDIPVFESYGTFHSTVRTVTGSRATLTGAINTTIPKGTLFLILSSASGLAAGDRVYVSSNELFSFRESEGSNVAGEKGEILVISEVNTSNNTIGLRYPTRDSYATGFTRSLRQIAPTELSLENLDVRMPGMFTNGNDGDTGVRLTLGKDTKLIDCRFEGVGKHGIVLDACTNFKVDNCQVGYNAPPVTPASGYRWYGISINGACQDGTVRDCAVGKGAEGIALSTASTPDTNNGTVYVGGVTRNVKFVGNIVRNSDRSAFCTHDTHEDLVFERNRADLCTYGFDIRCDNVTLTGNVVRSADKATASAGVLFGSGVVNFQSRGNEFVDCRRGFQMSPSEWHEKALGNMEFHDDLIHGLTGSAETYGLHINFRGDGTQNPSLLPNTLLGNITIKGMRIANSGSGTRHGIHLTGKWNTVNIEASIETGGAGKPLHIGRSAEATGAEDGPISVKAHVRYRSGAAIPTVQHVSGKALLTYEGINFTPAAISGATVI